MCESSSHGRNESQRILSFFLLFLFSTAFPHFRTQCADAGVPICEASGAQRNPRIAPDGRGGLFITWEDYRGGTWDIYAQRVAESGDIVWTVGGVPVCTAEGAQSTPRLMHDGSGGVYITWTDGRNGYGNEDIYVQRIDSLGGPIGPLGGVPVCAAANSQSGSVMVPDGSGGAIIAWLDARMWTDPNAAMGVIDVYAQRINPTLALAWSLNGNLVYSTGWENGWLDMVPDGAGGALLVWWEYIVGNVYVGRVTLDGVSAWAEIIAQDAQTPRIVTDGAGGAIIEWNGGAYAQRVNSAGGALWQPGGMATGVSGGIASDCSGGAIIGSEAVQRIAANGSLLWQPGGISTFVAGGIISDGTGGAIVGGAKVQRINSDGDILWPQNGFATGVGSAPDMISDGAGGMFITWYDSRNGDDDIFAQRVNPLLSPALNSIGSRGIEAGQTLTIQLGVTDPAGTGSVTYGTDAGEVLPSPFSFDEATGLFAWTPDSSDAGDYAVTFNVSKGLYYDEEAIRVSVLINGNRPPILAPPGEEFAYEGYPVTIIVSAVDPEGDSLCYSIDDPRYSHNDSAFVWHTAIGDAGTYHPTIAVSDGRLSDSATVTVTVLQLENVSPQHDRMLANCHPYFLWRENRVSWHSAEGGYLTGPEGYSDFYAAIVSKRAYAPRDTCALVFRFLRTSSTRYIVGFTATRPTLTDFNESKINYGINCDGGGYIRPTWANSVEYWHQAKLPPGIYDIKISLNKMNSSITYVIDDVASVNDPLSDFSSPFWSTVEWRALADTCYIQANALNGVARIYDLWSMKGVPPVGTLLQNQYSALAENEIAVHWTLSERSPTARFAVSRDASGKGDYEKITSPLISNEGLAYVFRDLNIEPGNRYRYRVYVADEDGNRLLFETELISTPPMPITLFNNYPNPFNPSTTIRFYLPERGRVVLEVYDVQGKRVARLVDGDRDKGFHAVAWTGLNSNRNLVGTGVYFYCLKAGKEMISRKMILVR